MKKVRVYEYAKEIGKQSKDIISVLKDAEIEVSNHMSMLTEEGLAKLDSVFKKEEKYKTRNIYKPNVIWNDKIFIKWDIVVKGTVHNMIGTLCSDCSF